MAQQLLYALSPVVRKPVCWCEYMNVGGGGMGLVPDEEDKAIVITGAKFSYSAFVFFKVLG